MAVEKQNRGMVGVRIEPELRAKIERAAELDRRSLSGFIRNVLCEYVEAVSSNDGARAA